MGAADIEALRRRHAAEAQAWADARKSLREPAIAASELSARAEPLRRRVRETAENAVIAARGIAAAQKVPSSGRALLDDRKHSVEALQRKMKARTETLSRAWEEIKAQTAGVKDAVALTLERSTEGRSQVVSAQQHLDLVRVAWEKDERALLAKSQLPTADKAYCDVLFDLAERLRVVNEQTTELRRSRGDQALASTSLETELEEQHAGFAKQIFTLLSKYDEVATTLAAVESKRRHLDAEAHDQQLAKAAIDTEWRDIAHAADRARTQSHALQKEAALVAVAQEQAPQGGSSSSDAAAATGQYRGGHTARYDAFSRGAQPYSYGGGALFTDSSSGSQFASRGGGGGFGHLSRTTGGNFGDAFSTLLRLPDDSSVGGTSAGFTAPGMRMVPSQSITTPSPDTDGS
jgi:hypothetical protein